MKKIIYLTFLLIISSIVISCDKSTKDEQEKFNFEKYNEVGKLHNEGLEFVFQKLKNQTKSYDKIHLLSNDNIIKEADLFLREKNIQSSLPKNTSFYDLDITFEATKSEEMFANLPLSLKEKEYMKEMVSLMYKSSNIEEVKQNIDILLERIVNDKSIVDNSSIIYACVVAKYSYEYWSNHLEEWITEFSNKEYTKGFWRDLRDAFVKTATMDATGAAVGAMVAGAGALPGALGTSLIYCTGEFVNSF